jgi:hypothetical protein
MAKGKAHRAYVVRPQREPGETRRQRSKLVRVLATTALEAVAFALERGLVISFGPAAADASGTWLACRSSALAGRRS